MLSDLVEKIYNKADLWHAYRIRRFFAERQVDAVIDVGAHKGEFIRLVVGNMTPIFAFEPQPSVHHALEKNLSQKNLQKLFKVAVSDQEGEIKLFINSLSSTSSVIPPKSSSSWLRFKSLVLGGTLVKETISVKVTTLDASLLEAVAPYSNILLKVDVEGNEGPVLAGAQRLLESGKVRFVQIESANFDIYQGIRINPKDVLLDHGFREVKRFVFPLMNFTDIVFEKNAHK